jgi:predicted ATP-grasp superfamily ATP-dependent carboligase
MRCLAAAGVESHLAGSQPFPLERVSRHCRSYARCDFAEAASSRAGLPDVLNSLCRRRRIEVIIPIDVSSTRLLAEMGELPGPRLFPLPRASHLAMLNNKWNFAGYLRRLGVSTPATMLIEGQDLPEVGFPGVVKPLELGYGAGVRRINSLAELRSHMHSGDPHARLPLLLQDYIEGRDVDLSMLARDGEILASAIQRWDGRGGYEYIEDEEILAMGQAIVSDIGYTGVAHFDLRVEGASGKPFMLECNPRFWGTMRAAMLHGVNFPYLGVLESLGIKWAKEDFSCRPGIYMSPAKVARAVLASLSISDIPPGSLRGFFQIAGDPLPDLCAMATRTGRRYGKMFRNLQRTMKRGNVF